LVLVSISSSSSAAKAAAARQLLLNELNVVAVVVVVFDFGLLGNDKPNGRLGAAASSDMM